jgi:hypothetical protein
MGRFDHPRGIADHSRPGRNILGHYAASAHRGTLADRDTTKQGGAGTDRCTSFDQSGQTFPVGVSLQASIGIGRTGMQVIREHYTMTHKNLIFQRDALANESMARDLTPAANFRAFLNFDEGADLGFIPDFAAVEVDEAEDLDAFAEFDVWGDLLVKRR